MTVGLKFAIVVTAVTTLIVSGILVAAATIPATAQGSSSSSGSDATSLLKSAKTYLIEATKNIKLGDSQAALMQTNMTRQRNNVIWNIASTNVIRVIIAK